MEPSSLADGAADQAARLALGVASPASIVSWADERIAELPRPPIELIELSLSAVNGADVLELLERLAAGAGPGAVRPALSEFGRQVGDGTIGLRDAMSRLDEFARRRADGVGTDVRDFLSWAYDDYDLIEDGYVDRTYDQLRADLEALLRRSAGEE